MCSEVNCESGSLISSGKEKRQREHTHVIEGFYWSFPMTHLHLEDSRVITAHLCSEWKQPQPSGLSGDCRRRQMYNTELCVLVCVRLGSENSVWGF